MTVTILTPNKISTLYQPIIEHFQKMLHHKVEIKSIDIKKKLSSTQQMKHEAQLMSKEIPKNSCIIAMDSQGTHFTSTEFVTRFNMLKQNYKNLIFIIGGPYGIDSELLSRANMKISLSAMTLPNQLAITTLIEQLYRAETIIKKHPYHK